MRSTDERGMGRDLLINLVQAISDLDITWSEEVRESYGPNSVTCLYCEGVECVTESAENYWHEKHCSWVRVLTVLGEARRFIGDSSEIDCPVGSPGLHSTNPRSAG